MPKDNRLFLSPVHSMLVLTALLCFRSYAQGPAQIPPTKVSVMLVQQRSLIPTQALQGHVVSLNNAKVATLVEGQLNWLAMPGVVKRKGEVLATLDDSLLTIKLQHAQAELARLQAELTFRQSEAKQDKEQAIGQNSGTTHLAKARAQTAMLQQQIIQAQGGIQLAQRNLALSQIKAPFDGVFVRRYAAVGEYIQRGDAIGRLLDTKQLEITVAAPISLAPFLSQGRLVTVVINHQKITLPVRTTIALGDTTMGMLQVRLDATKAQVIVGQKVTVQIPSGSQYQGPAIHRDALIKQGGQQFVYKVNANNRLEQVTARIALTAGDWLSLQGGIETGDQVVIQADSKLRPQQRVSVQIRRNL